MTVGERAFSAAVPRAAVILAAGAGHRLGTTAKALLRTGDGPTFLQRIIETVHSAGVESADCTVVVADPHAAATAAEARRLGCQVVTNPEPARGMASSVAAGLARLAARPERGGALIWPVDTPFVSVTAVAAVLAAGTEENAVIPTRDGRGGHPLWLGAALWPLVAGVIDAPAGLRTLLEREHAKVRRIDIADSSILADIDTPVDAAARGVVIAGSAGQ